LAISACVNLNEFDFWVFFGCFTASP